VESPGDASQELHQTILTRRLNAVCCPTLFDTTTADVVAGVVEAGFGFKRHFTVQMVLIVDSFK
jgi:hypothetical protein